MLRDREAVRVVPNLMQVLRAWRLRRTSSTRADALEDEAAARLAVAPIDARVQLAVLEVLAMSGGPAAIDHGVLEETPELERQPRDGRAGAQ